MVTPNVVTQQLKRIGFKQFGWGRAEVRELPHIILPDEEIFECVNGIYEGGFALLLATDVRVLLIDKKPFNYLTVEDIRFDMINEIDYSHRFLGANINISTGSKNLNFRSYNQPRLRKLIGHVQDCMATGKKQQQNHQEGQNQNLEEINQRLQAYLIAQHQHQEELQQHLKKALPANDALNLPEPPTPSPALSDYLFAQRLLAEHRAQQNQPVVPIAQVAAPVTPVAPVITPIVQTPVAQPQYVTGADQMNEIHAEGQREVFGKRLTRVMSFEINPLRGLYSMLPQAVKNRKVAEPS